MEPEEPYKHLGKFLLGVTVIWVIFLGWLFWYFVLK